MMSFCEASAIKRHPDKECGTKKALAFYAAEVTAIETVVCVVSEEEIFIVG